MGIIESARGVLWARRRQPDEIAYGVALYTDPIGDPAEVGAKGAEVPDMKFKAMGLISSDPDAHVRKIKFMQQLGATAIVIMNISGSDPLGMLRTYGEHVLPQLRGS